MSDLHRTPCGYQQITSVDAAVGLTVPTTNPAPDLAVITCEAQAVRWRDDNVVPTATVGMPLAVGVALEYSGDLAQIQFISQVSGAKLDVSYYKIAG